MLGSLKVAVDPSPFAPWLVDAAQIFGSGIGAIALIAAVVAIYRAETVASRERRIAHELEVLRTMVAVRTLEGGQIRAMGVSQLRGELVLMWDLSEFRLTRVSLDLPSAVGAEEEFYTRYPDLPKGDNKDDRNVRFYRLRTDGTYAHEWRHAMRRRVEPRRLRTRWRSRRDELETLAQSTYLDRSSDYLGRSGAPVERVLEQVEGDQTARSNKDIGN